MRRLRIAICLLSIVASACATTPAGPLATAGVRNFEEVNRTLSRGAQPSPQGVATLAGRGIHTLIDLRPHSENRAAFADEKAAATRLNRQFRSFELSNWFAPPMSLVEQVLAVIDNPVLQPVFVHCQRGADRTGTIVAAYRISHDCLSAEDAIREARDHGMGWWQFPMRRFIRRWYQAKHVEPCTPAPMRSAAH